MKTTALIIPQRDYYPQRWPGGAKHCSGCRRSINTVPYGVTVASWRGGDAWRCRGFCTTCGILAVKKVRENAIKRHAQEMAKLTEISRVLKAATK